MKKYILQILCTTYLFSESALSSDVSLTKNPHCVLSQMYDQSPSSVTQIDSNPSLKDKQNSSHEEENRVLNYYDNQYEILNNTFENLEEQNFNFGDLNNSWNEIQNQVDQYRNLLKELYEKFQEYSNDTLNIQEKVDFGNIQEPIRKKLALENQKRFTQAKTKEINMLGDQIKWIDAIFPVINSLIPYSLEKFEFSPLVPILIHTLAKDSPRLYLCFVHHFSRGTSVLDIIFQYMEKDGIFIDSQVTSKQFNFIFEKFLSGSIHNKLFERKAISPIHLLKEPDIEDYFKILDNKFLDLIYTTEEKIINEVIPNYIYYLNILNALGNFPENPMMPFHSIMLYFENNKYCVNAPHHQPQPFLTFKSFKSDEKTFYDNNINLYKPIYTDAQDVSNHYLYNSPNSEETQEESDGYNSDSSDITNNSNKKTARDHPDDLSISSPPQLNRSQIV